MASIIQRKIQSLHWSHWLGIFGLALLFVALRWNNFNAPLISDEGEIDYSAQLLIQGVAPYQRAFVQKPPGAIYSYALANLLLPHAFWAPRLLAYLFVALATILLGVIARLEFGEGVALPVMWLMTPMVLLPGVDQYSCNPEMFLLLPLIATLAIYCYSRRQGHANWQWFAAGFFGATTLIFKYTALPILAFVFIVWLFELLRSGLRGLAIFKSLLCGFSGGILAAALGLGFYLVHHAMGSLWECTVAFNRYYVAGSGVFHLSSLWANLEMFWNAWWILFLVPWAVLLRPQPRALFWLGLFLCAFLSTSESYYRQYYIPLMPFWALLTVLGIRALGARLENRPVSEWRARQAEWRGATREHIREKSVTEEQRSQTACPAARPSGVFFRHAPASRISGWMARPGPWLPVLITAAVVIWVVRSDVPWMLSSPKQFIRIANEGYPFIEAQFVADKVSRMTSPNDFVYVAGSDPEILCYAQRFSPTRFITSYPLMIPSPLALSYQRATMRDLEAHPPRVIVFVSSGTSWIRHAASPPEFFVFLNDFLQQHYEMIGGYVKTDEDNGYWSEPITTEEFKKSTLVLFKLKH